MNFRAIAAVTAMLCATAPSPVLAQEDAPSYPKLTHCAAFNMLLSQMILADTDSTEKEANQVRAKTFAEQAEALVLVAAVIGKTDPDAVERDVFAQNERMVKSLAKEGVGQTLMAESLEPCSNLGMAAYRAVQENGDGNPDAPA